MPRSRSDFIERSIETLLVQGALDARLSSDQSSRLPCLDLSQDLAANRSADQATTMTDVDTATREENRSDTGGNLIATSDGDIWLSGNAVMCGCPDCDAPVSVRLWLMVADCWNCQSAIELSYEQQQAAEKLARQVRPPEPKPVAASPVPTPIDPDPQPEEQASVSSDNEPPAAIDAASEAQEMRRLVDILRKMTDTLPAWLISLLVHLVMILILALILLPQSNDPPPSITLSTAISPVDEEGGIFTESRDQDDLEFDTFPDSSPNFERELRDVKIAAEQDAKELQLDPDPTGDISDLESVKKSITQNSSYTFAGRDPRLRSEIVHREGGTTLSEAAVSRGLRWLASVQNDNGSWSLADYKKNNRSKNKGDMAATSLALLPFLGAGQTHEYGKYKSVVAAGLKWMLSKQKHDGELMYGINTNAAIYAHGQASIVLVEALAMTGDEQFRAPAQKAIDYIQAFQHKHGGWRYRPHEPGDTSVMGWQLMALQSARSSNTGLLVDDATLRLADQFLDQASRPYRSKRYATAPAGTLYRYQTPDRIPKIAMTAEAMLCRMYLGWKRSDGRMLYAVDWLLENGLPSPKTKKHNLYYYYYATQVMHHFGGRHWQVWNNHLRDLLVVNQIRKGRYAGSWDPSETKYGESGGRIYATALSICTLEVYYRHLPLFKQLELD